MNKIKTIMALLILTMLATFTACSPDGSSMSDNPDGGSKNGFTIHLKLSTSASGSIGQAAPHSRALTPDEWESGSDVENMKSWFVVLTQGGNVVQTIEKTQVDAQHAKEDEVTLENVEPGTYQVYSFANIDKTQLGTLTSGSAVDFKKMKYKMNGNGFDATISGIPMSNEQTLTVNQDGTTDKTNLWVVRMLAKVTLQFKNPSATPLVINDITISDITKNSKDNADADNIMLLPKHSDTSSGADKDDVTCTPNLVDQAATQNYTYPLPSPKTIKAGVNDYTKENEISFYVNESKAGNTSKYFIINLNTSAGVKRYALFQDWTTIARNDHHILQIKLDDYKLKFDVQSFTAIGLYPSIKDNGTTLSYTCYYPEEEFHIQPKVVEADDKPVSGTIDYASVKWELIKEEGIADETANAQKVFKVLPSWDKTTGYFEGTFNDDKADKQSALYQVTVPVPGETDKYLTYKILFTKDLRSFSSSRKHYTRQSYYYRTKQ